MTLHGVTNCILSIDLNQAYKARITVSRKRWNSVCSPVMNDIPGNARRIGPMHSSIWSSNHQRQKDLVSIHTSLIYELWCLPDNGLRYTLVEQEDAPPFAVLSKGRKNCDSFHLKHDRNNVRWRREPFCRKDCNETPVWFLTPMLVDVLTSWHQYLRQTDWFCIRGLPSGHISRFLKYQWKARTEDIDSHGHRWSNKVVFQEFDSGFFSAHYRFNNCHTWKNGGAWCRVTQKHEYVVHFSLWHDSQTCIWSSAAHPTPSKLKTACSDILCWWLYVYYFPFFVDVLLLLMIEWLID